MTGPLVEVDVAELHADYVRLWSAVHDFLACRFAQGYGDDQNGAILAKLDAALVAEHNHGHATYISVLEPDPTDPGIAGLPASASASTLHG